jgi:hypothetical protein
MFHVQVRDHKTLAGAPASVWCGIVPAWLIHQQLCKWLHGIVGLHKSSQRLKAKQM